MIDRKQNWKACGDLAIMLNNFFQHYFRLNNKKKKSFLIQTLKSGLSHQTSFEYDSGCLMKYELLIVKHEEIK